jgi:DNA-binding CsgD family transcriptional regulator
MNDTRPPATHERRVRREQHADQLRWIAQARSLAAAFDLLRQPIVLLLPGEPIRVWHANSAARDWFGGHAELRMRDGLLEMSASCARLLADTLALAQTEARGQTHALLLPSHGEPTAGTLRLLDFGASTDLPVSTIAMLELREPVSSERGVKLLCAAFQLTRKEAEAALGLYSMGSVESLARCNGRSIHTIRTQLKAAMQKTGTHTQAALVALVADRLAP